MDGKVLLDTNIVIALFGGDALVRKQISRITEVFIPSIVLGELYYGAFKSKLVQSNFDRLYELTLHSTILPCDQSIAEVYGYIKNQLRAKGLPVPENDIWIAAIAMHHNLTLVTRDDHFQAIDDITIASW
ncbi:MAG TPA: type II toxin-antitoxin system VapC family toxin [Bacteroidota bacterium]